MKTAVLMLMLLVCAPCIAQENNKALAQLFERYQEEYYKLNPLAATADGENRYNDQLPAMFTDSYRQKMKNFYQQYLKQLGSFNRASLNSNDKLSFDVLKYQAEMALEGMKYKSNLFPIHQMSGIHLQLPQLGSGTGRQPFNTVKDYDNWVGRMNAFPAMADSIIAYFRKGMKAGYVYPKTLVVKMIPQLESFISKDPSGSTFYGPINKLPADFAEAEKERLKTTFTNVISSSVVPAYQRLATFLKEEYLPVARGSSGLSALPGGKEWYAYNVKLITTTNKTPEEIHNLGLGEVKRIRGEMEKVKQSVDYTGSLNDFLEHLRTDPKFYPFTAAEQVLQGYRDIEPRIAATLQKMFTQVPRTSFEVRQTEAFRAASAAAEYNAGLPDGSRPGIFYVPIVDPKKVKVKESLFIHEAIPGHHYQIMLQRENNNLPAFRRNGGFTAYAEGWGLYAESLGKELGLYTDPYQYMDALGSEIHRAIRLVVDPAIHVKGWSREQAIKYMMENEPITEQAATAEIERYMAMPGQAVAYKIGGLKIQELRKKYEKMHGKNFSLAQFHHQVLNDGMLPLDLLEKKLDVWARSVKR